MNPDLEFSHMSDNISCFFFEGGHFLTNCKIVLITKTWARSGPEVGHWEKVKVRCILRCDILYFGLYVCSRWDMGYPIFKVRSTDCYNLEDSPLHSTSLQPGILSGAFKF
jgi:hypothetical protein